MTSSTAKAPVELLPGSPTTKSLCPAGAGLIDQCDATKGAHTPPQACAAPAIDRATATTPATPHAQLAKGYKRSGLNADLQKAKGSPLKKVAVSFDRVEGTFVFSLAGHITRISNDIAKTRHQREKRSSHLRIFKASAVEGTQLIIMATKGFVGIAPITSRRNEVSAQPQLLSSFHNLSSKMPSNCKPHLLRSINLSSRLIGSTHLHVNREQNCQDRPDRLNPGWQLTPLAQPAEQGCSHKHKKRGQAPHDLSFARSLQHLPIPFDGEQPFSLQAPGSHVQRGDT